ncbi:hypothetical protein BLM37_01485 [Candidatus Gracilibacteria bacterium GN02-873]|nr:hypothetical protein BLM37_01485 [Candidatus Gracilibacteria bacterium GN02-873]
MLFDAQKIFSDSYQLLRFLAEQQASHQGKKLGYKNFFVNKNFLKLKKNRQLRGSKENQDFFLGVA